MIITKENLVFKRLDNGSNVLNAVIDVSEDIRLSISKSDHLSAWDVGDDDLYEVAVQAYNTKYHPYADIIQLNNEKSNVVSNCNLARINRIAIRARDLKITEQILFPDEKNEGQWRLRFYLCSGADDDYESKLKYCQYLLNYRSLQFKIEPIKFSEKSS